MGMQLRSARSPIDRPDNTSGLAKMLRSEFARSILCAQVRASCDAEDQPERELRQRRAEGPLLWKHYRC